MGNLERLQPMIGSVIMLPSRHMVDSRLESIISYFRHPITNGPQEGMNAKLMSIIRAARGYRTAETFRMAALFFMGRLDMTPRWRHA